MSLDDQRYIVPKEFHDRKRKLSEVPNLEALRNSANGFYLVLWQPNCAPWPAGKKVVELLEQVRERPHRLPHPYRGWKDHLAWINDRHHRSKLVAHQTLDFRLVGDPENSTDSDRLYWQVSQGANYNSTWVVGLHAIEKYTGTHPDNLLKISVPLPIALPT